MPHFDLIDMRLMVSIAEANSLTRGAERSNMSLSAASARVKNLEASLGTALLYRTSQGVTLTAPGKTFAHHSRMVLSQLEQLSGDLREYANGLKGHLRLSANTTSITEFLPAILKTYLSTHPDVNIELRERLSQHGVRAVSTGAADVALVSGVATDGDLQFIPYRTDRLVLATPPVHPLAQCDLIDFERTLDYEHIGLSESSAIHPFLIRAANEANRSLRLRIQVGNFEGVCKFVEVGVGIAVLPQSAALRLQRSVGIRIIPLSNPWALRQLLICVRDVQSLPSFATDLIDMLVADAECSSSVA